MAADERNQMHATEPDAGKNKMTEQRAPACAYSLESLMSLQKLLENGIPEAGERLLRSAQSTPTVENVRQSGFRPQPVLTTIQPLPAWPERLWRFFSKLGKPKEADKGHSAQQTG